MCVVRGCRNGLQVVVYEFKWFVWTRVEGKQFASGLMKFEWFTGSGMVSEWLASNTLLAEWFAKVFVCEVSGLHAFLWKFKWVCKC